MDPADLLRPVDYMPARQFHNFKDPDEHHAFLYKYDCWSVFGSPGYGFASEIGGNLLEILAKRLGDTVRQPIARTGRGVAYIGAFMAGWEMGRYLRTWWAAHNDIVDESGHPPHER
ncbi:hypothetical protein [Fontivita pretiosa]|uniref:hypothetical protein n=1 Tax=Fontivita pretiosa TaxID=2989684 RepID=UPI003D16497C